MTPDAEARPDVRFERGEPDTEKLIRLAASGFGVEVSDRLRRAVLSTMGGQEFRVVSVDGETAGFLSFNRHAVGVDGDEAAIYLKGIVTGDRFHGSGTLAEGLRTILTEEHPRYLALATQSPRVYGTLRTVAGEPYPRLDGSPVPGEIRAIAERIAELENKRFPLSAGLYGSSLYGEIPRSRDPLIQDGFVELCPHPEQGDAVFCVVVLEGPAKRT